MKARPCLLVLVCCLFVLASCSEDNPSGPSTSSFDRITDLRVMDTWIDSATLAWTSHAEEDGLSYDARYLQVAEMGGLEQITEALWAVADTVAGEPMPSEAGAAESLMISGLQMDLGYYVAVRTVRKDDGEMSDISNTVRMTTDVLVSDCSAPHLAIPDNPGPDAIDYIAFPRQLEIKRIQVYVNITHTYIADLIISLTSPGGTRVYLHDQSGGSADNIVGTYGLDLPVDGPGSLDDFIGDYSLGDWKLTVDDNWSADVGTLNEWCIYVWGVVP